MSGENGVEYAKIFEDLAKKYKTAFNAGDVEGTLNSYTEHGVTVVERGMALSKSGDLREALSDYFKTARPHVEFDYRHTYVAGDIALVVTEWTLDEHDENGELVRAQGQATDVLTRDTDGEWRFAIDNRFGAT